MCQKYKNKPIWEDRVTVTLSNHSALQNFLVHATVFPVNSGVRLHSISDWLYSEPHEKKSLCSSQTCQFRVSCKWRNQSYTENCLLINQTLNSNFFLHFTWVIVLWENKHHQAHSSALSCHSALENFCQFVSFLHCASFHVCRHFKQSLQKPVSSFKSSSHSQSQSTQLSPIFFCWSWQQSLSHVAGSLTLILAPSQLCFA